MARLAAIEKALFYPTGTNIIELFADTWQPKFFGSKKPQQLWVDPCCGEGEAVAYLRDMWQDHVDATIYGIELDQGRAEKAQKVLDQVINAPAQQVEIPGLIDFLFMKSSL